MHRDFLLIGGGSISFLLGSRGLRATANRQGWGTTVTSYPSYPSYPATPPQLSGPTPVQVAVAEAAQQRRATVAFRLILAIPHLFVLYFLGIAAEVVVFIGWWGALFMGRLPDFAANFLSGYVRWCTRVYAYMFLLTDVYPPFTLEDDPGYPVRIAMTHERLNRLAVLFRLILAIPAAIVSAVAVWGAMIVSFIAWLITLVAGKLPPSLHLAFTAVLRYQIRYISYLLLLTPTYPGALFGDGSGAPAVGVPGEPTAWDAPAAPGYGAPGHPGEPPAAEYGPPGYSAPGYGTAGSVYDTPPGYGGPGGYGTAGGYGAPRPGFQPASWQLILTSAARRLVVLFVVLGALIWAGYLVAMGIITANAVNRTNTVNTANNAIDQLNSSYSTLTSNLDNWQAAVKACDTNLTCVTKADGKAAAYFSTFASQLQATPMPPVATAAASRLHSDATQAAQDFTQLSKATSVSAYQSTFASTGLQQTLDTFDQDFNALGTALENS